MEPIPASRAARFTMQAVVLSAAILLFGVAPRPSSGQGGQAMGTVPTIDASVNGQVEVHAGQAQLLSNVSVTAFTRTAPVTLNRGGDVMVCSTSQFHLLRATQSPALVFGLDRGALELHSPSQPGDIVITPDLKLTPVTRGQYDLRLRVTREGDTCIDNAGANAPVLNATDAFSSASYRVLPGQHLLFVKGDLHQVVDHERSPCGCPSPQLLAKGGGGNKVEAAHPFPQAESEGLAPTAAPSNAAPVGTPSSQVTTSFSYGPGEVTPPGLAAQPPAPTNAGTGAGSASATPPKAGFFGSIGHFFRKIFHTS